MGPAGQFAIPGDLAATRNAEFNLCALATPVSTMGLEQLVTQDAVAVASRLMLKLNDIKNSALAQLSTSLFGTNMSGGPPATPNPLQMFGLLDAYDDGTSTEFYGGIDRTAYPTFAGLVIPGAGPIMKRISFIPTMLRAVKHSGGEALDFVVTSIEDWTDLMTDFIALERFNNDPSSRWGKDDPVNSGFRGLMLGDTPIFFDLNCPQGTAIGFNSKYITLVIHEDANFAWTGWYSTIPQGQIASVGLTLTALNLVCSKPSTGVIIKGITDSGNIGTVPFTPQPPWTPPAVGPIGPPIVAPGP
jgi:hypothetical protein